MARNLIFAAAALLVLVGMAFAQTGTQTVAIVPGANPVQTNTSVVITLYTGSAPLIGSIDYAPSGLCAAQPASSNVPNCRTSPDTATQQCPVYNGSLNNTKISFIVGKYASYVLCSYVSSGGPAGYSSNAVLSTVGGSGGAPGGGGSSSSSNASSNGTANEILSNICSLYTTVRTMIFIVALILIVLGGVIYAASHISPGQSKGSLQGYGIGMVIGGVVGLIIAVLTPYIFQLITGNAMIVSAACA